MAEKGGPDNPDQNKLEEVRAPSEEGKPYLNDSNELQVEVLQHLHALCEQLLLHVCVFDKAQWQDDSSLIIDDLSRIRNDLAILEKHGIATVVNELLELLHVGSKGSCSDSTVLNIIESSAIKLSDLVSFMIETDEQFDSALSFVRIVNDCRACMQSVYLSDAVMLSIGMESFDSFSKDLSASEISRSLEALAEYASLNHANLGHQISAWHTNEKHAEANLLKTLIKFETEVPEASAAASVCDLINCATIVLHAVKQGELENGPGISGLFDQLYDNIANWSLDCSPDDLVEDNLLRNFLFYVAQTRSPVICASDSQANDSNIDDSVSSIELRRKYRLDRLHIPSCPKQNNTPTIGVDYQVSTAIRQTLMQRTENLARWFENADDGDTAFPALVQVKVRMMQLEQVLGALSNHEGLGHLRTVNEQLRGLKKKTKRSSELQTGLVRGFLDLDAAIEKKARLSVAQNRSGGTPDTVRRDVYIDLATDACLLAASSEIRSIESSIGALMLNKAVDVATLASTTHRLQSVNSALQILPLPEVSPVIAELCTLFGAIIEQRIKQQDALKSSEQAEEQESFCDYPALVQQFSRALSSLEQYLECVLLPLPLGSQLLNETQEHIVQLQDWLADTANDRSATGEGFDAGKLNLEVGDELLLEPMLDSFMDNTSEQDDTLNVVFQHECEEHLQQLSDCVKRALKPSADGNAQLPNENMLRALHTLTMTAQTMGASKVLVIAQPLQRAALSLHREGKYFNATHTRYVGELVTALRARLESSYSQDGVSEEILLIESRLVNFLSEAVPDNRLLSRDTQTSLSMGSQITSLNSVFAEEASQLLAQLEQLIVTSPFNEASLNEALGVLHTLKGSARVVGKLTASHALHALEYEISSADDLQLQLSLLQDACSGLRQQVLYSSNGVSDASKDSQGPFDSVSDINTNWAAEEHPRDILTTATDLAANQARVSQQVEMLQSLYRQHRAATLRWSELLRSGAAVDSAGVKESVSDMQACGVTIGEALHQLDLEQQQALRGSSSLQQLLVRSKITRLDSIEPRLMRVVEEAAAHIGVSVKFLISGGDVLLESDMYQQIIAPLEHLVRNAVVHGMETNEVRSLQQKTSEGLITLVARIENRVLSLSVVDDGRGVDLDQLNLQHPESIVSNNQDVQDLLFTTGFSTVDSADSIVGHGLGLTAVSTTVARLNGSIRVEAVNEKGFSITLSIPQALVVEKLVLVEQNQQVYGFPISDVSSVQLSPENDVSSDEADVSFGMHVEHERGEGRAFGEAKDVHLCQLLEPNSSSPTDLGQNPGVLVERDGLSFEIQVDRVLGYRELITQPLGEQLASLKRFSSGGVTSEGRPVLVLEIGALLKCEEADRNHASERLAKSNSPTVFVIDDSHTARRRVCDTLEKWGVKTHSFNSGLDALDRLSLLPPDLIIVDLEMPQLDGSALVRRIQEKYAQSSPPIIMVSTNPHQHNRGNVQRLGVSSLLAKPFTDVQLRDALNLTGLTLPDLTIA